MHAEKGKPGQYVGKVDADSPAELAGLREGDRIIEVNGTDIGSETHKQVVERIKVVPHETTLLVIDPHSFSQATKNGSTSPVAKKIEKQAEKQQSMNNNNNDATDSDHKKTDNSAVSANATTTTENNNTKVANETVMISEATVDTKVTTTTTETGNHHVNNHHNAKMTTTTTTVTEKPAAATENNNHDKNHENNSSAANGKMDSKSSSNGNSSGPVLNLNMTATELRAKLLAKKKYDPKNDSIDLRKKHDIIEKM